jgi:hypothetical protein
MLNMNCGKYDRFWCSRKLAGSSFRYSANLQAGGSRKVGESGFTKIEPLVV